MSAWYAPSNPRCYFRLINISIPSFQMTYYLWMFHIGVLVMNVLGGLALFISNGEGTVFGLGILYLVIFAPSSFVCWYRPLYKVRVAYNLLNR